MPLLLAATIEETATRIETAYLRRHPDCRRRAVPARVWADAAAALLELHRRHPNLPIDPELYVAAQPTSDGLPDPWEDLTRPEAARRYRRRVGSIVRSLRRELLEELARIDRRSADGASLDEMLLHDGRPGISALGRYVAASRAGRADLAERFRAEAVEQHRACPLYRNACADLLAAADYPIDDRPVEPSARRRAGACPAPYSLN